MIQIVKQIIEYYAKNFKTPSINDIKFEDESLLEKQGSLFVTIYKNGEIRGSSGNIKEIKSSLIGELIENTIEAISKDSRFEPIKEDEINKLKIRIDLINNRQILQNGEINKLDPSKNGIIVIKKDYEKMACILPNINPKLFTGEDFIPVIKAKLNEKKFDEKNYIIYKIDTSIMRD